MLSSCRINDFLMPSSFMFSLSSTLPFLFDDLHRQKASIKYSTYCDLKAKMPKALQGKAKTL